MAQKVSNHFGSFLRLSSIVQNVPSEIFDDGSNFCRVIFEFDSLVHFRALHKCSSKISCLCISMKCGFHQKLDIFCAFLSDHLFAFSYFGASKPTWPVCPHPNIPSGVLAYNNNSLIAKKILSLTIRFWFQEGGKIFQYAQNSIAQ